MNQRIRRSLILICLVSLPLSEFSCIRDFGIAFPSIGRKKQKRKIAPSFAFNTALFEYRKKHGYWPKSEYDFLSWNSEAIKGIYELGFESWTFGNFSTDTLYVHWIHAPLEDGAHVGGVPVPYRKIYLISKYIYPTRNVTTRIIRKKKKNSPPALD